MRKLVAPLAILAGLLVAASAWAQSGLRNTPAGFCALSSVSAATNITTANCVFGSFTGAITGTTLTVTAVTGSLLPGQVVVGTGISAGTFITAQSNGTPGKAGIYQVNNAQSVASEAMTTAGIPPTAQYAVICASVQAVNYRDDLTDPTITPGMGGQFIPAGSCLPYNGTFIRLKFIQQVPTAILGISFYQ